MSFQVKDLISQIVDGIRDRSAITSVVDLGGGDYEIFTPNTFSLAANDRVILEGPTAPAVVTAVTPDVSFVVRADALPLTTEWAAAYPYFFYGDPRMINRELSDINSELRKYSAVFMIDRTREKRSFNKNNEVYISADLTLFFCDKVDNAEYGTTQEHYIDAIEPMTEYVDRFEFDVQNHPSVAEMQEVDYIRTNGVNFGRWLKDNGDVSKIFDDDLSGILVEIDLPIYRSALCKDLPVWPRPCPQVGGSVNVNDSTGFLIANVQGNDPATEYNVPDGIAQNSDSSESFNVTANGITILPDIDVVNDQNEALSISPFPSVKKVEIPVFTIQMPDGSTQPASYPALTGVANTTNPITADFSVTNQTPEEGEEINFTSSTTGGVTTIYYDFGDGTIVKSANPAHTYAVAGNYTVEMSALNAEAGKIVPKVDFITVLASQRFSLSYNAVNEFMTIPSSSLWNFGNGDFTVSCWIKRTGTGGVQSIFGADNAVTVKRQWQVGFLNDRPFMLTGNAAGGLQALQTTSGTQTDTSSWHLVVFVKIASQFKIYWDASDQAMSALSGTHAAMADQGEPLYFGAKDSGGFTQFLGANVSDNAVWSVGFTQADVDELYGIGGPGAGIPINVATHSQFANCVGAWNGGTQATFSAPTLTAPDVTANANNETSSNMDLTNINVDAP